MSGSLILAPATSKGATITVKQVMAAIENIRKRSEDDGSEGQTGPRKS